VKAVLRRCKYPEETLSTVDFRCGQLRVNFAQRRVFLGSKEVSLTATEYALLRHLALNANCVVLREELLAKVWGPQYRDDVDYLRAYVRYLRLKIEDNPSMPKYIVTKPGVGYMLACPDESSN
jgi:two-component system KDP operon response regulator KdpE